VKLPASFAPRRVAILRPRGLGDVVLSSAVIDALTRAYPRAEIDYVAEAPALAFLEKDARLSSLFLLGRPGPTEGRVRGGGTRAAIAWLRERRADAVFDLFSNPKTAILSGLSGAAWRAGYDRGVRRVAYNIRIPRFRGRAQEDPRWAGEVLVDFVRQAGVAWRGEPAYGVSLDPSDRRFADEALAALGYGPDAPPAAILPGGSWATKRWSPGGFAAAGEALAAASGRPALVIWGPPEREDAQRIADLLGDRGRLAPPSTLRGMAALVGRSALLLAPDCLGRHLAIVQGVPTIGVFGSTDPKDWTPPRGPHRVVRAGSAGAGADLASMGPDAVLRAIQEHFGSPILDTPRERP
jgi:ADP-heptose:LPS heptosyltransferase